MTTMTTARTLAFTTLAVTLAWATAACGDGSSSSSSSAPMSSEGNWREPPSYTYTLESSEGERSLTGVFEVTVQDGEVTEAVGRDESARRVVKQLPGEVPTIGDLLAEAREAQKDDADTVDIDHMPDGRPIRISLDWDENAIDDEALYVISDYEQTT